MAVEACVPPRLGPRRSRTKISEEKCESACAMKAPEIPAPTITISAFKELRKGRRGGGTCLLALQTDWPVRKFLWGASSRKVGIRPLSYPQLNEDVKLQNETPPAERAAFV